MLVPDLHKLHILNQANPIATFHAIGAATRLQKLRDDHGPEAETRMLRLQIESLKRRLDLSRMSYDAAVATLLRAIELDEQIIQDSNAECDHLKSVPGLKWIQSHNRPKEGKRINNQKLEDALCLCGKGDNVKVFARDEWDAFGIQNLCANDFVKSGASYWTPKGLRYNELNVERNKLQREIDKLRAGAERREASYENLRKQDAKNVQELTRLQNEIQQHDDTVRKVKEHHAQQLREHKSSLDEHSARIKELEEENEQQRSKLLEEIRQQQAQDRDRSDMHHEVQKANEVYAEKRISSDLWRLSRLSGRA